MRFQGLPSAQNDQGSNPNPATPWPYHFQQVINFFHLSVLTHNMAIMTTLHRYTNYEGKVCGTEPLENSLVEFLLYKVRPKLCQGLPEEAPHLWEVSL